MAKSSSNSNGDERTTAERAYDEYLEIDPEDVEAQPDVLLDVPNLKVEEIDLKLENLKARVNLQAQVLDLVQLNVGAEAELGEVELNIKGVEAQALLKVRLEHVAAIIHRVLTTLDRNPEIVESLATAVEEVGSGTGSAVRELGEGGAKAVEEVGEGAGEATKAVGEGAGEATEEVGEGAGEAAESVGEAAEDALEITDAARELAEENDVDLGEIDGSGKDGRILVDDVEQAIS